MLRDYPLMIFIVLLALSFGHFTKQWTRLEALPTSLWRSGLLRTDVIPQRSLEKAMRRMEETSCQLRWEFASVALAVVTLILLAVTILDRGLYPLLDYNPRSGESPAQGHLEAWWANPHINVVGFVAFSLVIGTFAYLTIRHTVMGAHVLLLLYRLRKVARDHKADGWYGYCDRWAGPEEGLQETRGALVDVFISVSLGALAGAAAVYALELPPFLITVLLIYLGYNLLVFFLPWMIVNRQLSNSKLGMQRQILGELRDQSQRPDRMSALELVNTWNVLNRVDALPDRVIPRLPLGLLVALYLIPIVGIIPAYR